ncbi:FecCD family ABC transporter permease [Williamsia deligens]|uniref:FecCD family ABC transporter permease n=1 Tax=Williamsia deligens TaxID=321325 RepID=A0ABW3G4L2_9NOCA|nr:iron ABC transporter permease [Williamsia deligens]
MVRVGPVAVVVRPRLLIASAASVVLTLTVLVVGLGVGDFPLGPADVIHILLGGGTRVENVVVFDVGLPRVVLAILVGLGLGLSGALTQTVARNPLATPDILGITAGASAAAVVTIAFGSTWGAWLSGVGLPVAALLGGLLGAVLMYALAWRGGIDPFRLVLVGVALTWVFQAIVSFGLTRAQINDVARAQRWLVGSVSAATWTSVAGLAGALVVGLVVVASIARGLSLLSLGDDLARGLGVRADAVGVIALLVAVVVSALTVAAAGPVAFVALLAPQIAQRLGGTPSPPPVLSGLFGAVLVSGADLLCRSVLPGGLAVGVVTAAIGGPFLIYLMIAVSRKASA